MLSINQLDYLNYRAALKGNYRKGVHAFRAILENPAHAADFASNLGGVSLVLGWPTGHDDRNSRELLDLLLNSSVLDKATLTWLSQWYPEASDSWDTLASDQERAAAMVGDPLIWRAVGYSPVTFGKVIAGLVGLTCAEYADIYAVVSSSTAMTAVAASEIAMTAVATSEIAMTAVAASEIAMTAVAASEIAMTAVAASEIAMTAVAASEIARAAIYDSDAASTALTSSPLKTTATTTSAYGGYTQLVSGRACFVISASSANVSGYAYAIRYAYISATEIGEMTIGNTNYWSINRFTTNEGLAAYANKYSMQNTVTITYIPC